MTPSKFERFLPLAGVLAALLLAVETWLPQLPEDVTDPARALAMMQEHETANAVVAVASAYLAVLLLFFAAAVRQAIRSGESGGSTYSSVAFGGGVLLALYYASIAWLIFAGLDAAAQDDEVAMGVFTYLGANSWVAWSVASATLLVATGLGGLRTGALPRWLAIVTLVLGIGNLLGPPGILVYFLYPVWLAVTGVVLSHRQASTATPATAPSSSPGSSPRTSRPGPKRSEPDLSR